MKVNLLVMVSIDIRYLDTKDINLFQEHEREVAIYLKVDS